MKTAIVVCTRLKSSRVPNKCALNINGEILLEHLNKRLQKTNLPIIYAIPHNEKVRFHQEVFPQLTGKFKIFVGDDNDPMSRMYNAAKMNKVQNIIRVTHDKTFVDVDDVAKALTKFTALGVDYLYSSHFTPGVGFEIIRTTCLEKAVSKFKNVEHVSYAVKAVTNKIHNLNMAKKYYSDVRLLIDFPEDIELMNLLFACLGNDCTQEEVFQFMSTNEWAKKINKKPYCTVYTCALNAEKYIEEAMYSVSGQVYFNDYEYLLIDDHSTDRTPYIMAKFASKFPNVRYIRNHKNIGLASSSNVALSNARGRYIVRLDADDYFLERHSVIDLIDKIETSCRGRYYDVIYPNYFDGNRSTIKRARKHHHVGGALFNTRALNNIKFTEGLRNYDSLDLFGKARELLDIGYYKEPIFMYRQRPDSMSKTNLQERARVKKEIEARYDL